MSVTNDEIVEFGKKISGVANRLFSSEDGKFFANQMFKACRLFGNDKILMNAEQLRYYSAQQDFVNSFITKLVDKDVLLEILNYEQKE